MGVPKSDRPLTKLVIRARRSLAYRSGRLVSRVMCELKERKIPYAERLRQQREKYASLGLDRDAGNRAYVQAVEVTGMGSTMEVNDSRSEHKILLGALSERGSPIHKVLEIGTLEGATAVVLSHLFPEASITTLDLPPGDPVYQSSYEYSRSREFIEKRNANISRSSRIRFRELNSLCLSLETEDRNYDLVWVDGDHDFPTVGIDLANAARLLRPGGYLLCDDVIFERVSRSNTYNSNAAHRSLIALQGAGLIERPIYLYKRLGKREQHPRKFVAITRTRATNSAN